MRLIAAMILLACLSFPAQAAVRCLPDNDGRMICRQSSQRILSHPRASRDPRPARWCAWWLRRHLHIPRSAFPAYRYNLARAFRHIGVRARGPAEGVIVVWRHHVGLITGRTDDGRWIVKSGNDGGRVRERVRSLRGAIAFRWPRQKWASR